MSKVVKKRVWWTPVEVADLIGYKVYVVPAGEAITDQSYFVSVPKDKPLVGGKMSMTVPDDFTGFNFEEDKPYQIGISSVDDNQGESDPFLLSSSFDFVPPPAPLDGGIVDA